MGKKAAGAEAALQTEQVEDLYFYDADKRKRDKVAIVGFASHWNKANFEDQQYEIWGLNELYDVIPWKQASEQGRLRWFEIHSRVMRDESNPFVDFKHSRVNNHAERLTQLQCPVYMQEFYDDVPNSVRYPIERIRSKFRVPWLDYGEPRSYITNSISFMIALAIDMGFKEISIYGVDMAQGTEYCVAPNTRVLTADLRWIPASEVQVGQELIAFDEEPRTRNDKEGRYRQWQIATVKQATRLTRPCYRLHMADGTTLVCSAEHGWLVHRCNVHAWQITEKIQAADIYPKRHSKIVKLVDVWEEDNSRGAGYLAAAFDGEGHISQKSIPNCASNGFAIGFAQRDNAMSETVEEELRGRDFPFTGNDNGIVTNYTLNGGRPEKLRFLGQIRPPRLLEKFNGNAIGIVQSMANVPILKKEYLGEQPVIGLGTTTGTFIAEGFASHNSYQRPSCEFFIGWALALGIKVHLPLESDLCKEYYLYGYEQPVKSQLDVKLKFRKTELQKRLDNNRGIHEQVKAAINMLRGAIEYAKKEEKDKPKVETMQEQLAHNERTSKEILAQNYQILGALEDIKYTLALLHVTEKQQEAEKSKSAVG